jgi:molybdopterin synthase sulfur carrier subunit
LARVTQETASAVQVEIPSPLRSYTRGQAEVGVAVPLLSPESSPSVEAVLAALDGAYPGIRHRMVDEQHGLRPHIKLFVGSTMVLDLHMPVPQGARLMIVAALSGG